MQPPPRWSGLFAVLVTPFTPAGAFDDAGAAALVDFYLGHGASGLVIASVFGEGGALTGDEREHLARLVIARAAGRAPVLLGSTTPGHDPAAWGIAGVLAPPRELEPLSRATDLPLVLLDYPPVTGDTTVDDIAALAAALPRLAAIKLEAVPTWHKIAALRARLGDRLRVFGAMGGLYAPSELHAGSDGLMTGAAFPEHLVAVLRAHAAGDPAGAATAHAAVLPRLVFEAQPGPAIALRKAMLALRGVLGCDRVRPPLAPLDAVMRAELRRVLATG